MARLSSLALLIAFVACSREPLSIHPSTHYTSRLAAPRLGGDFDPVGVDISVPEGYSMQILQGTVNFRRRNLDPAIQLYSQGGNDQQVIDNSGFTTKDCGGGDEHLANVNGRAARTEARPDGWMAVCVDTSNPDNPSDWRWTKVVRDVQWDGAHYQCHVMFRGLANDDHEPDYAFDRGRPSQARITDAIEICDSMKFHKLSAAEQKLYWTGSAWVQQP